MVCTAAEAVAIGTECPKCGCEEAELVRRSSWWGKPTERVACGHCGTEYTRTEAETTEPEGSPCIVFPVIRCPRCRSKNTRITSTRDALRWHSCDECQRPFRSLEQ